MPWQIKTRRVEKIDRFEITIDRVIVPNGEEKPFSFVNFTKGVCILPINTDNQVICLKQYRHAIESWQWELPAGMLEANRDPLDMAKQELQEETGYSAEEWISLGSFYPSPGSTSEEIFLFAANGLSKGEQNLESSEQIILHELPWDEVIKLIADGDFQHGAGLAAFARYISRNS